MIWKILTVILAVSVAVLIAVLVKIRAQLRDINEQLDFLLRKGIQIMLLLTVLQPWLISEGLKVSV